VVVGVELLGGDSFFNCFFYDAVRFLKVVLYYEIKVLKPPNLLQKRIINLFINVDLFLLYDSDVVQPLNVFFFFPTDKIEFFLLLVLVEKDLIAGEQSLEIGCCVFWQNKRVIVL